VQFLRWNSLWGLWRNINHVESDTRMSAFLNNNLNKSVTLFRY
jgi:hypothetical protein